MEFSFDRSKDSSLRNNTSSRSEVKPEPVATQAAASQAASYDDGIDTSTIQNERLRKAIERNRARQAERAKLRPEPVQSAYQQHFQATQSAQQAHEQSALFEEKTTTPAQESPVEPPPQEAPRSTERAQIRTSARSSAVVTRRSVARPDDTDFTPAKRTPRKVASQISYSTSNSKKKTKSLDPNLVNYLVKGCWIFCGIMILRLIFANGGVTDFYSRKSILDDRMGELDRIKKENMQLVREIERMRTDVAFQKKLVRDNLGFISSDEFLILFPKEKSLQ